MRPKLDRPLQPEEAQEFFGNLILAYVNHMHNITINVFNYFNMQKVNAG